MPAHGPLWLWFAILVTGVYGGYFGAAQGVLLMAILGIGLAETLPRINALKNVLAADRQRRRRLVFVHHLRGRLVDRPGRCAVGSVLGAQVGARVGRRLPPMVYRVVIVFVGVVAIVSLVSS